MKRIEALQILADTAADLPLVATLAATSRELAAIADRPNHLYVLDAMGLTPSIATGLAMALDGTSVGKVVAIDGDGSILMNLNALATLGYLRPERLVLVILDNQVYASTANIPTYTERIDLGAIADACGLPVLRAGDQETLARALEQALAEPGPHVLHARIEPGNAPNTPLLLADPVVIAARFSDWLAQLQAG
jgi:thiamine pyrophosphate-dependent acetolactate synthase large subunit-like protein